MTDDVLIRAATLDDVLAIAEMHVDTTRATYRGIMSDSFLASLSYEERAERWRGMLQSSARYVFVATLAVQSIIGVAVGCAERGGSTAFTGELGALYVHSLYQRRGIGHRLVATIANDLAQRGHRSMLVWVLADNPYRRFYETLGGTHVAEKVASIGGSELREVSYGWSDLSRLVERCCGTRQTGAGETASLGSVVGGQG